MSVESLQVEYDTALSVISSLKLEVKRAIVRAEDIKRRLGHARVAEHNEDVARQARKRAEDRLKCYSCGMKLRADGTCPQNCVIVRET